MKPLEIKNLHGMGLMLDRTATTIHDRNGSHRGDDEIILYVPDASEYDTDYIQNDCAMLHFSPSQAKALARKLWKLAKQCDVEYIPTTMPLVPPELEKSWM